MKPSDFIDVDTLPALTLNENEGRKAMERLNSVPMFTEEMHKLKLTFLSHYLLDHLKVDVPDIHNMDKPINYQPYAEQYPVVWDMVSRSVDRHVFMLITAMNSFSANFAEEDDDDLLNCHVYAEFIIIPAVAFMIGDVYTQHIIKLKKKEGLSGVLSGASAFAEFLNSSLNMFGRTASDYVQSGLKKWLNR